jgi:hypothetical protein
MRRPLSPAPGSQIPSPEKKSTPTSTAKPSFSERKAQKEKMSSPIPADGARRIMRDITRPPPGDITRSGSSKSQKGLGKRRSNVNFFEDAFAVGESSAAKERVRGDAIVFAEVKTNVIVSCIRCNPSESLLTECLPRLVTSLRSSRNYPAICR